MTKSGGDPESLLSVLQEDLGTRTHEVLTFSGFRRAAVLVPLLRAPDGLHLLFTVRSSGLSNHAGQIAFPGGRLEPGESVADAARRETLEETGLNIAATSLLGRLSDQPSPARYLVTPLVGVARWPQPLTLNPGEVADTFTVPLAELLAVRPRREERQLEGQRRVLHFYAHGQGEHERLIWGLTGNIVADFLEAVRRAEQVL